MSNKSGDASYKKEKRVTAWLQEDEEAHFVTSGNTAEGFVGSISFL